MKDSVIRKVRAALEEASGRKSERTVTLERALRVLEDVEAGGVWEYATGGGVDPPYKFPASTVCFIAARRSDKKIAFVAYRENAYDPIRNIPKSSEEAREWADSAEDKLSFKTHVYKPEYEPKVNEVLEKARHVDVFFEEEVVKAVKGDDEALRILETAEKNYLKYKRCLKYLEKKEVRAFLLNPNERLCEERKKYTRFINELLSVKKLKDGWALTADDGLTYIITKNAEVFKVKPGELYWGNLKNKTKEENPPPYVIKKAAKRYPEVALLFI